MSRAFQVHQFDMALYDIVREPPISMIRRIHQWRATVPDGEINLGGELDNRGRVLSVPHVLTHRSEIGLQTQAPLISRTSIIIFS